MEKLLEEIRDHLFHIRKNHPKHDDYNELVKPFRITNTEIPANNILDDSNTFSPEPNYIWDVLRITAQGFTAGTVTAYIHDPANDLIQAFTSPGSFFPQNKGDILITGRNDRLVFVAASITGVASVSMSGISVHKSILGKYLSS